MSPVLLYTPEMHLKSMRKIYVDDIVKDYPWQQFILKLDDEWGRCVICVRAASSSLAIDALEILTLQLSSPPYS